MKKITTISIKSIDPPPTPPPPPPNISSSSSSAFSMSALSASVSTTAPSSSLPIQPPSPPPSPSSLGIIIDDNDNMDIDDLDNPLPPVSSSKRMSIRDKIKGIIKKVSFTRSKNTPAPVTAAVTSTAHTTTATDNTDMDDTQDQYEYYDLPPVDLDDTDDYHGQQSSSSSSAVADIAAAAAASSIDTAPVSASTGISRNNRLAQYLKTHTYQEIKEMASSAPRTSGSVQRHDYFFKERYHIFCENAGVDPLPFTRPVIDTFFWTMCQVYRWTSVENHAVPALKRFHFDKTGNHVSPDVDKMLSDAKKMARHSAVKKGNDMRSNPVLYKDLLHIIKSFPAHYPRKAYDVSAYLLAFNTGARVSSVVNVQLKDIVQVVEDTDGSYMVRISFRKIKNEVTPFKVTIGGRVYDNPYQDDASLMDFFNWFRIHLLESFNLDLLMFGKWKITYELGNKNIWPDREDTMSKRFKERATKAGYDPKDVRMTFHSLRSGFLTQTMLNHRHTPAEMSSAINRAAAVARWNPSGKAILKYRRDFDETILSSNLVNPGSQSSAAIPDILTTSEGFHGITVGSSTWDPLANFKGFRAAIMKKLKEQYSFLDDAELKRLGKLSIERALYAYGKDDKDIVAEFYESEETHAVNFFNKQARRKIANLITDNPNGFNDLVDHFFNVYISALPAYHEGSTTDFIVEDDQMDMEDDQVQASGDDDDDNQEEAFDFDQPDTDDDDDDDKVAAQMEHDQIYGMQYHGDDNDDDDHML